MIDENPYAPPKSTLEDFRQPEIIAKPTKMQRLFRVVLFPVLLPIIATVLYPFLHLFIAFLINFDKFRLSDIRIFYLLIFAITIIQSIIFSLILEFALLNSRNKNIYSLWGGFLISISVVLFLYIITDETIQIRDMIYFAMIIISLTISSYLTTLILNAHISYYNRKNRSGSLTKAA